MDARIRQQVWQRAGARCEYCRLKQEHEMAQSFHVEHIIALQHRGDSDLKNLALACSKCNAYKGPNLTSRDPDTGTVEVLYHPREHRWEEHFCMDGPRIRGITPTGRTTVWLLQMNAPRRVDLRMVLIQDGEWD
jgi:hypothetical protein